MNLLSAPREDLIKTIYDLTDQNNALREQITELKGLIKNQRPAETKAPDFVRPDVKKRKKKDRKKRELNFARKRENPDKYVFHSYDECPECNEGLGKPSVAFKRQIIDIPLPKVQTTEHVIFKRWCSKCQIRVYPKVNLKDKVISKQRFGINLTSLVTTLNEEYLQPINKIQRFLKMTYELEVSEGGIVRLLQTVSTKGKKDYQQIEDKLRKSKAVYADETGSRENGKNGYEWSFSDKQYQLVKYQRRRNKGVVKEFVTGISELEYQNRQNQSEVQDKGDKDKFEGVLITDFFRSYNEYEGFHQRCWVHFLRDIKKLKEKTGNKHPPLNIWAKKVRQVYKEAKGWDGPSSKKTQGLQAQLRIEKEDYFKKKLREICSPWVEKDVPMSTLSARVITHLPELFTFIRFEDIESDNNRAERALRHSVVKRKISGGTRSEKGSRTREIMASLFGTWRLQGLNPLEQTKLILANA